MKKMITLVTFMIIGTGLLMAQSTPDNSDEAQIAGIARAELAQSGCFGSHANLDYWISPVGSCDGGGMEYEVTFYQRPCPPNPNIVCIAVIIHIGTVHVDCDGNATLVNCGIILSE